ncbi:MAG TPA: hypothetical protein PKY59_06520 [Pyrinomonadaceae bacterium]|nr:hypothetical protein [Pyrinomonadaceae bacterium]
MKNTILKTIGAALAILMIAAFANISAFAQNKTDEQSNEDQTQENSSQNGNAGLLQGSWNVQVTRRNCQTGEAQVSFPTMSNFNQGGTMNDYGIMFAPTGRGPSFGVWKHQSGRRFTNNFQFFLFGTDGATTGRQIVKRQIEVNRAGNEYTATGSVQVFNTAGTVVATVCTTETAVRFE